MKLTHPFIYRCHDLDGLFEKTKSGYLLFTQNNEVVALNNNFEPHKKLFQNPSNASIYYTYYDSTLDLLYDIAVKKNELKHVC